MDRESEANLPPLQGDGPTNPEQGPQASRQGQAARRPDGGDPCEPDMGHGLRSRSARDGPQAAHPDRGRHFLPLLTGNRSPVQLPRRGRRSSVGVHLRRDRARHCTPRSSSTVFSPTTDSSRRAKVRSRSRSWATFSTPMPISLRSEAGPMPQTSPTSTFAIHVDRGPRPSGHRHRRVRGSSLRCGSQAWPASW